jgi:hypothetical protein
MSFIARKNREETIKKFPKEVAAKAAGWGHPETPICYLWGQAITSDA